MKRTSVAILFAIALISLNSCRKVIGHGPVVSDNRSTSNFTSINFRVPGDLYYVQDSIFKIEIQAQENILRQIETYTIGTELMIKVKDLVNLRSREDIRVTVSAPSVTELSLKGSGNIKVLQAFKPSNVRLSVSGSGTITINQLSTNNIDALVSGSGEVFVINGVAKHTDADISGSGRIDLLGLATNTARTDISGSGSVKLNVKDELNNKISGSGTVYYKGNPIVNTNISGSGKVIRF